MCERIFPRWKKEQIVFILSTAVAAFSSYFCMYAFRKPFTVANYAQAEELFGLDFKSVLIIAQVVGYAVSKFIGIRVIAEMSTAHRGKAILLLVMASQVALITFALLPDDVKWVALFFNGLPLGMIWGLVFSYLEGRRTTEILAAILSVSFIVSTGVVKSAGLFIMLHLGVNEYWMPAATGLLFTVPLFLSVRWLASTPAPSIRDIGERRKRQPMSHHDRLTLISYYFTGLACLTLAYMLLSAIRDFSDNFATELWQELGYGDAPGIFAVSSIYASLVVLILLGCVMWINNHFRALMVNHIMVVAGFVGMGVSSLLFQQGILSGLSWMISLTVSIYLAYVPFNCIVFERLVCLVNVRANAGFLIYIADAAGYAGGVAILLFKSGFEGDVSWVHFLIDSAYFVSIIGMVLMLSAATFFRRRLAGGTHNTLKDAPGTLKDAPGRAF